MKLKDKLGTHQLPTAELLLNGSKAYLISPKGKGIKLVSEMLNITRIYNAGIVIYYDNQNKNYNKLKLDII